MEISPRWNITWALKMTNAHGTIFRETGKNTNMKIHHDYSCVKLRMHEDKLTLWDYVCI